MISIYLTLYVKRYYNSMKKKKNPNMAFISCSGLRQDHQTRWCHGKDFFRERQRESRIKESGQKDNH